MTEHANATLIRLSFDALEQGDLGSLGELFAPDAELVVAGGGPLPGRYTGRDEILAHHERLFELTGGTFRAELRAVTATERTAVAIQRLHGKRRGKEFDLEGCTVFQLNGGRITAAWQVHPEHPGSRDFWR